MSDDGIGRITTTKLSTLSSTSQSLSSVSSVASSASSLTSAATGYTESPLGSARLVAENRLRRFRELLSQANVDLGL
jgi:hypothetical protein